MRDDLERLYDVPFDFVKTKMVGVLRLLNTSQKCLVNQYIQYLRIKAMLCHHSLPPISRRRKEFQHQKKKSLSRQHLPHHTLVCGFYKLQMAINVDNLLHQGGAETVSDALFEGYLSSEHSI
jgi:hypothetical protein